MRLLAPLCLGAALLLSSCTLMSFPKVPVAPPPGFIFSSYKAPLMTDMEQTPASTMKTGKATTQFMWILYPTISFAYDDASIEQAAKNGGITKIHYADYEVTQVNVLLFAYTKFTTIVYGE